MSHRVEILVHVLVLVAVAFAIGCFVGTRIERSGVQVTVEQKVEPRSAMPETLALCSEEEFQKFVEVTIQVESGGDPNAKSPAGARGLMQVMEGTWNWICRDVMNQKEPWSYMDAFDPVRSRAVGEAYIKWLMTYWNDNRMKGLKCTQAEAIICSYNGGQGMVGKAQGDIQQMPEETQGHVVKFRAAWVAK